MTTVTKTAGALSPRRERWQQDHGARSPAAPTTAGPKCAGEKGYSGAWCDIPSGGRIVRSADRSCTGISSSGSSECYRCNHCVMQCMADVQQRLGCHLCCMREAVSVSVPLWLYDTHAALPWCSPPVLLFQEENGSLGTATQYIFPSKWHFCSLFVWRDSRKLRKTAQDEDSLYVWYLRGVDR